MISYASQSIEHLHKIFVLFIDLLSVWLLVLVLLFGFYFSVLSFVNFDCLDCRLVASAFVLIAFSMHAHCSCSIEVLLQKKYFFCRGNVVICFLKSLSKYDITSSINISENSLRLRYQLSMNSWSWLPRMGSSSSFNPSVPLSQRDIGKKSLCETRI